MRLLELTQAPHERVVLGVGDLRLIEDVIEMLVAPQLVPELGGLATYLFWSGHHL